MPALPLNEAGIYVAAAYIVFLVLVVMYVSVMSRHVARVRNEVAKLAAEQQEPR
jgi:uncharacterized protein with FMN-binding domain